MIPDDDQAIAVQRGSTPRLADLREHLFVTEVFLPERGAVHVVRIQPARFEERKDASAVGDCRARRPRPILHRWCPRTLLSGSPLPQDAAGPSIDGEDGVA